MIGSRLWKYIFSDLKNNSNFTFLFVLNISIGLIGFITLDIYKNSLNYTLQKGSQALLGADLGISARRPLTQKEKQLIVELSPGQKILSSQMTEVFSMVASSDGRSRLVQIKAIESNFPFYGKLERRENKETSLLPGGGVWVYPEVLTQLKIKLGDKIKIGKAEFKVTDIVDHDPGSGFSNSMSPRIYIAKEDLKKTELIRPGSIAWHSIVYKAKNLSLTELKDLRDQVFEKSEKNDLKVYTHEDSSEQMGRILNYLNDFLGLTAIAALFLASVGGAFLFRNYIRQKTHQIAILRSLGFTPAESVFFNTAQLISLSILSALFSGLFSVLLVHLSAQIVQSFFPFELFIQVSPSSLILGLLIGVLGGAFMSLPLLTSIYHLPVTQLFQPLNQSQPRAFWKTLLLYIPSLLLFWGLCIWQAHSLKTATLFLFLFLLSLVFLYLAALFFLSVLLPFVRKVFSFKSNPLLWSVRDLQRLRFSSTTSFVSLGLGLMLLNLVPQLKNSIENELSGPNRKKLPSLFLFDIQEDQISSLQEVVQKNKLSFSQVSPMIRARIHSVNGQLFDKGQGEASSFSREKQRENRFRNRGVNLSYRSQLLESESIIAGKKFSGVFNPEKDELAEISLEKRYAARLGLSVGDQVTFDIESILIKGRVINLRSVKWTSFQPNFFIQLQPGVLEEAPKTFIATIPHLSYDDKLSIQDSIVEKVPNVSIVDVSRTVDRIQSLIGQMGWALQIMSLLCLIAGFSVLYSIANHQMLERRRDIGLMKILGAHFSQIRSSFYLQFTFISASAGLLGVTLSLGLSYLLTTFVFDSVWKPALLQPLSIWGLAILISLLVIFLASRKALKTRSVELIQ